MPLKAREMNQDRINRYELLRMIAEKYSQFPIRLSDDLSYHPFNGYQSGYVVFIDGVTMLHFDTAKKLESFALGCKKEMDIKKVSAGIYSAN